MQGPRVGRPLFPEFYLSRRRIGPDVRPVTWRRMTGLAR